MDDVVRVVDKLLLLAGLANSIPIHGVITGTSHALSTTVGPLQVGAKGVITTAKS